MFFFIIKKYFSCFLHHVTITVRKKFLSKPIEAIVTIACICLKQKCYLLGYAVHVTAKLNLYDQTVLVNAIKFWRPLESVVD